MQPRFNYMQAGQGVYHAMLELEGYVKKSGLELSLLHLIKVRASQINGCAYCLDMHWKDAVAAGETPQRLYSLDAWRECPYYSDRERAALAWTDAVTLVSVDHVPDEVFAEVRPHFNDKELCDLTLAICAINSWNRLLIAGRVEPGTYRVQAPHELKKGA